MNGIILNGGMALGFALGLIVCAAIGVVWRIHNRKHRAETIAANDYAIGIENEEAYCGLDSIRQ